ncbi:hypothetical protein [Pedobacter nyackensis]|uniref:hypothetical protein n=1 Tax=Pedobacter nyackensis TaxID=475255 RepID=UPI00292D35D2|nr:hypothetical protein [Pedobacter nyackensis]
MSFSVRISRLEDYKVQRQQLGLWNRLVWLDNGCDALFIHSEVDFWDNTYKSGGWLLEFNSSFYRDYALRYPEDFNNSLMTDKSSSPITLPLSDMLHKEIHQLAGLLKNAYVLNQPELYLQPYADLILLNVNRFYTTSVKKTDLLTSSL